MKTIPLAILATMFPSFALSVSFADYCKQANPDKEIKTTVQAVLSFYETRKCEEPQKRIDGGEKHLRLLGSKVRDIKPIAALDGLEAITLVKNRVATLEPLANYQGLRSISVIGSPIKSISPLFTVSSLRRIDLYRNGVTSLDGIGKIPHLHTLTIQGNPIQDYSPVGQLKDLAYLHVGNHRHHRSDAPCKPQVSPATGFAEAVSKLKKLESLQASGIGLENVDFIPQESLLTTLDLSCNRIKSIDSLVNHPKISTLNLSYNPIERFKALNSLPELVNLNLVSTGIESLDILLEHTDLLDVTISGNRIHDLSPLVKSQEIQAIFASHNSITDIAPLAKLPNLRELELGSNPIGKLPDLKGFRNLIELDLSNTPIESLEPLKDLKRLNSLSIKNIGLFKPADLNYLGGTRIRVLELDKNNIDDLSQVSLPTVKFLYVDNNNIRNVRKLGNFPNLAVLTLRDNPTATLAGLCESYAHLAYIDMSKTSVTSLSDILSCENLSGLDLSYSLIRDFENLTAFKRLRSLAIAGLGLDALDFLQNLSLGVLDISDNKIVDVAPLARLKLLRKLSAENNKITSIMPLKGLSGLDDERHFKLGRNPIGTSTKKTPANCPIDALGSAVARWCSLN